ncbi:hypothetical protein B0O80DRAFT_191829 [Mortierella sp. GBAus27b]|nr:hypothetical protein B0O80DRAFT_191829 [Mortierella sp. GBAus27b]
MVTIRVAGFAFQIGQIALRPVAGDQFVSDKGCDQLLFRSLAIAMTPTSFHSITDIPELLLLVAERLEPRDIARCMATCKVLARSLEPLFWKHVIINEKWPPKEAMLRHRHTTRTLSIQSDTCNEKYLETLEQRLETLQQHLKVLVQDVPDPHQCQLDSITDTGQEIQVFRLQRIEMMLFGYTDVPPTIIPNLVKIIHHSYHSLTSLTMTTTLFGYRGRCELAADGKLWDRLHNLEHLVILPSHFCEYIRLSQAIQWMTGCFRHPRLTKIHCLFGITSFDIGSDDGMQVWTEAVLERIQRTGEPSRIKDLRLPTVSSDSLGYRESFLIPFLRALGPSLEKMNGPRLWGTYGPALVEMVQSNCPNLRHLAADMFWSEEWEVQSIITMIQACRHAGLESFRFNCAVQRGGSPPHQAALFDELITHHAATLQVIENENGRWRRECQLRLMETCPNLRRLWFDPNILASSYAMLFCIQVVEREWVCLHLKELVLNYSLKISRVKETRALYKQLGRLVHLEVLAIGRIPNKSKKFRDMTLSDGYLGMLAGLNKMRDFHVSKAMWDNLGPEEVAFIKQEWPQLQRVSFGCSKEQFNEIRVQDHWARLCEERPWIKLSRGYQP